MRKKVVSQIRNLKEKLNKTRKGYLRNRNVVLMGLAILSLRYHEKTDDCDRAAKSIGGFDEYEKMKDIHYRSNMWK